MSGRKLVVLGDIVDDLRAGFAFGGAVEEGVIQFRMNNVDRDGTINWEKIRRVPASKLKSNFELNPGDILFNSTNSPDLVGKTALFVGADDPVTFSNHFLKIRLRKDRADAGYVSRWLRRQFQLGIFKGMCRSWVNQASITKQQVASLHIPLPPLNEQRRIAAILDKADELRQKRKKAIALFDSLTQSIFLEMFGDPESGWKKLTVQELALNIRTGPFGSQLLHSEFVDQGIAVLGIDNAVNNEFEWQKMRYITEEKFSSLKRYRVQPRDVILTIMGTCGRCAVVPENIPLAINTKHLCCITVDQSRIMPEYLHACFLYDDAVRRQLGAQAKGAVMPGLNMGIVKAVKMSVPPLHLQEHYTARVKNARLTGQLKQGANTALGGLFASLQHRAFSGQL